jgi:hypothetical protein
MRGMGRIFKRGGIAWIAYCDRGKEYRESSESPSMSQARKLLKKRLGEIGSGKLVGPIEERVTFEELAGDLVRDYTVNKRKAVKIIEYPIKHLRKNYLVSPELLILLLIGSTHILSGGNRRVRRMRLSTENLQRSSACFHWPYRLESYLLSRISLHWTMGVFLR